MGRAGALNLDFGSLHHIMTSRFSTARSCSCLKIEGVSGRQPDLGKSLGKVLRRQHFCLLQAIQRGETAETLQGQSWNWKLAQSSICLEMTGQSWSYSGHFWHLHCQTVHCVQLLPGNHHQCRLASHMGQSQQS